MTRTNTLQPMWIRQSVRCVAALLLREMSVSHGRLWGGYLWAVLEPAAGIALLSMLFSMAFHAPPLGNSFPIFYASALLPYTLYVQMNVKLMQSIWFSKPLLQHRAISFIDAIFSRTILTAMTQLVVFVVVILVILALFQPRVTVRVEIIALSLSMAAALGMGVGVLNCFLSSSFPVWQRIWGILHRPMFLISGIFFVFEAIPAVYRDILWFNPLIHIIGVMRRGFYPTYEASYAEPLYVFGLSLTCLVVGLFFLRLRHRDILLS